MAMILTNDGLGEMMINRKTGRVFRRELTEEERASIESANRLESFKKITTTYVTAEKQLEELINAGFNLEEIVEFAINAED